MAMKDLDQILLTQSNNAETYFLRGEVHEKMNYLELAVADFERAILLNPFCAKYYYHKGRTCASIGRYQDAVMAFTHALGHDDGRLPLDDLYQKRALVYMMSSESDKAFHDFEKCLQEGGDSSICHYYLGCISFENERNEDAIRHFDEAIQASPDAPAAYYSRAQVYQKMDRHDLAISDLTFVLSLDPKDANTYFLRGNSFFDINRHIEAIEDFSRALEFEPGKFDAYCCRAAAYYEMEQVENAFADIQKAIELDHAKAWPFIVRAMFHVSNEKREEALADLAAAEEREPGNPTIDLLRAEVWKQLGKDV